MRALVADAIGEDVDVEPEAFPNGAALVHRGTAWVLADGPARETLGPSLAWSLRRGASALSLIAEADTGLLARRADRFTRPIDVWFASERSLLPALAEPLAPPPQPRQEHLALRPLIERGGAEPIVEHGVVSGEVRGLEVCRVVDQPTTGFFEDGGVPGLERDPDPGIQLEVGVGAADREAFQLLHGDIPTVDALCSVVDRVLEYRSSPRMQHPLNRLARERFLRWTALVDPSIVGLASLAPGEPPLPRQNLKDAVPCVASGADRSGRPVTVVFSAGVDLGLLPFVADVAATTSDDLVVALPGRDLLPITRQLADALDSPVEFVTID